MVVHGSRCVGHGRCAEECPVGAIALTLGDRKQRDDLPALSPHLEAIGSPGLFLAGEVTGFALVRNAVEQGRRVAAEVGRRVAEAEPSTDELDLVVVGAGPAGLEPARAAPQCFDFQREKGRAKEKEKGAKR